MKAKPLWLTGTILALLLVAPTVAAVQPFDEPLDPDELRRRAQTILNTSPYTGERDSILTNNPISRFLEDARDRIAAFLGDVWDRIGDWLTPSQQSQPEAPPPATVDQARPSFGWLLLIAVAGFALLFAALVARRLIQSEAHLERALEIEERGNAQELEQAADVAEADGRYDDAVRLRFRAGLLRLDELDVIEFDPAILTGAIRTTVRMSEFDSVASQFERVAYSDYRASPEDPPTHIRGWRAVLDKIRPREQNDD